MPWGLRPPEFRKEKKMEFKGIKEALKQFKEWRKSGRVVLMVDFEDGAVWTDCFPSYNEWKVYHSDSVTSVDVHKIYYDNDGRLTEEGVRKQLEYQEKIYKEQ